MTMDDKDLVEIDLEDYSSFLEGPLDGEVLTGIIAGLPVIVIEDSNETWISPANWFSSIFLIPYMASWFYDDSSPIFIYEDSYWDGLFDWVFMFKEE